MSILLKNWLVSGTREYYPGKSVLAGNVVYYTFFNGISIETYSIEAQVDIISLPIEPNLTLFNVLDPRTFTITAPQDKLLITMPGDTVYIDGEIKRNLAYGKILCFDLEPFIISPVISHYFGSNMMIYPELTELNIIIPNYYPSKLHYDIIYRQTNFAQSLRHKILNIRLTNLTAPCNFNVKIHFQANFNYAINNLFDIIFYWYINYDHTNIETVCQDGNTYIDGLTQRYTTLTTASILTFNVVKLDELGIINITQII